jgi:hypothetical protein
MNMQELVSKDSPEMSKLKHELSGYIGTEQYWKGAFTLEYTDGVKGLIELANCYWLITDLSIVSKMKFKNIPFQVWTLTVKDDHTAVLKMQEDTGAPVKYRQEYGYTDFPVGVFKLWVTGGVLILPSEY